MYLHINLLNELVSELFLNYNFIFGYFDYFQYSNLIMNLYFNDLILSFSLKYAIC